MKPVNYDGRYHGPILFRDALANSYNIPPIQLIRDIGIPTFIATARKLGIESLQEPPGFYGLALTLGGGEVPTRGKNHVSPAFCKSPTAGAMSFTIYNKIVLCRRMQLIRASPSSSPIFWTMIGRVYQPWGSTIHWPCPSRRRPKRERPTINVITGRLVTRPVWLSAYGWETLMAIPCVTRPGCKRRPLCGGASWKLFIPTRR